MKKKQIVICDRDSSYTMRFTEYVNRKKDALFLAHGFLGPEELEGYLKLYRADILLIAESYVDWIPEDARIGQVVLLGEKE